MKGEVTRQNIQTQKLKVQRLHPILDCVRTDRTDKVISELVKPKLAWITLENLNISPMMKTSFKGNCTAEIF